VATIPWQFGNVPGPKKATAIDGKVAGRLIKVAKRPLIIVGAEAMSTPIGNGKMLIDYVIELAKITKAPVVATSNTLKAFLEREFQPTAVMASIEVTDRLRDPNWSIDGSDKPHDLVIYVGITYQLQSQLLSTIKNFATHLRSLSLDRYYHPNATFSFPNLAEDRWVENLNMILKVLSGEGK